jgi:hypothetical protein
MCSKDIYLYFSGLLRYAYICVLLRYNRLGYYCMLTYISYKCIFWLGYYSMFTYVAYNYLIDFVFTVC